MSEQSYVTREMADWIKALAGSGLVVVGANGQAQIAPQAGDLISRLHDALGGSSEARRELDAKLIAALGSLTAIMSLLPEEFTP